MTLPLKTPRFISPSDYGRGVALWDAIWLGIIQGLTEFLPVSSSAHLRVLGEFLPAASDPGATFTAITQIGTEIAVLIYFRKDLWNIASSWLLWAKNPRLAQATMSAAQRQHVRLGWLIVVGSIPLAVTGYLAQDIVRNSLRSLWLVAWVFVLFGLVLWAADHFGKRLRTIETLTVGHGLLYGLAQTLALIPGVSRSGATITMGRALGYTRTDTARYSFLLAIPAVLGSGFYELRTAMVRPELNGTFTMAETFIATAVSFIVGFIVIAWLMKYIQTRSFLPFVIYRIVAGVAIMVMLSLGVLSPL
jgi:undecaprenyl-diphosphatase